MPPLLYWALEDIEQTLIAGGFSIVTTSDVPCHMWLRHTLEPPQKHAKPVERRGLIISWDARFCFVAFEDLEQDEPGDTFIHTFTWTGWEICQTRYFYFWATSWGEKMKSTSCLFSKHYLVEYLTAYFYPDAHPESTSCDGWSGHLLPNLSWSAIRGAPGNIASDEDSRIMCQLRCSGTAPPNNNYDWMRGFLSLDLSSILGHTILSAEIHAYGAYKIDNANIGPQCAFYNSYHQHTTQIVASDYGKASFVRYSSIISYDDFKIDDWNIFTFRQFGIDYINARLQDDGIVKVSFRERRFDAGCNDPFEGLRSKQATLRFEAADAGVEHRPYLKVTYV